MGVRLLSRRARGPASAGIDPAKRPARDARRVGLSLTLAERAQVSRWARGSVRSTGIDPARRLARDAQTPRPAEDLAERAGIGEGK